jgi:hypothetical protein
MSSTQALLNEIDRFLADFPMADTTLGNKAAGNVKLIARLRAGDSCTLETADKLRAFMTAQRKAARKQEAA